MPDKRKKFKLAINIILILLFAAAVVYITAKYGPYITRLASKPEHLKSVLNSYGWKGIIVFILLQVLQVVIVAIPGEFVQVAGGYIYGVWLGTLYSFIGIVLGSVLIFLVSRFLGYSLVKAFVSPKSLEKFSFMMNNNKSEIPMFVRFLIPGMPKDILTYIASLTPIKPLRFFIVITAGRFPALFASSYIGYSAQKGNYLIAVVLSAAALALFAAGVFFKDRIIGRLRNKAD